MYDRQNYANRSSRATFDDAADRIVDFQAMVEAVPIGITEIEPGTGRVLFANQAFRAMTGYSAQEFVDGKISFVELTHPDDRAENVALHRQFLRGEITCYSLEKRYVRKDGSVFHVRVTASGLRQISDGVWRSIGIIEELTGAPDQTVCGATPAAIQSALPKPARRSAKIIEELTRSCPDKVLDVASIARAAGVSERAIYHHFAGLGCTPAQYAKRIRLDRARALLLAGDDDTSVTDIALGNGFSNLGHFARDYRRTYNELPSETLARARERRFRTPRST